MIEFNSILQDNDFGELWAKINPKVVSVSTFHVSFKGHKVTTQYFIMKVASTRLFLYLPRLNTDFLVTSLGDDFSSFQQQFTTQLITLAKEKSCDFVHYDEMTSTHGISMFTAKPSFFKLMHSKTSVLHLPSQDREYDITDVSELKLSFEHDVDFWLRPSKDVRQSIKKAFEAGFTVSLEKTEKVFNECFLLAEQTGKRQSFKVFGKEYLRKIFFDERSRVITIKKGSELCSFFLGYSYKHTLYFHTGANSAYGLENNANYLLQLAATVQAKNEKLSFYDMGGFDEGKGYGQFKAKFKGEVVDYGTEKDLVVNKFWYGVSKILVQFSNLVRR
jgi:hypothetical protein